MALESIRGLLKRSVRRAGIEHQTEAAQIFDLYLDYVNQKIGAVAQNRIAPQTLVNGALRIEVRGSALAAELRTLESELLQAINKKSNPAERAPVQRIVYRVV